MQYDVRELKVGEILTRGAEIVQEHFAVLFGIAAIVWLPVNLVIGLATVGMVDVAQIDEQAPPEKQFEQLLENAPVLLGIGAATLLLNALVIGPVTQAAVTHAVARVYLGKPVSIGNAYAHAFSRLLPLLGSWLLAVLAIMGGYILLIVPGIIFSLWFAFVTQVVVLENLSGPAALGRSRRLVKGSAWTVLGMILLLGLIGGGVGGMIGMIPQPYVQQVVTAVVQAVMMVFGGAVFVVFYFSQRCKHEEFDLDLLAETFEHGALCQDCGERLPTNVTVCPVCGTARSAARNLDSWED